MLLTSYIAHTPLISLELLAIQQEMTDRGFHCLSSNQVEIDKLNPKESSDNRVITLLDFKNAYFLLFLDYSGEDHLAMVELGLALSNTNTQIAIIGAGDRTCSFMYHKKCAYYDTFDNFLFRHFKF